MTKTYAPGQHPKSVIRKAHELYPEYKHPQALPPAVVLKELQPIYKRLSQPELLQKCMHGKHKIHASHSTLCCGNDAQKLFSQVVIIWSTLWLMQRCILIVAKGDMGSCFHYWDLILVSTLQNSTRSAILDASLRVLEKVLRKKKTNCISTGLQIVGTVMIIFSAISRR